MTPDPREFRPQRRNTKSYSASGRALSGVVAIMMRRPGQVVFSATAAALGAAILLNALVLQTKRHPSPIFAGTATPVSVTPPAPSPRLSSQAPLAKPEASVSQASATPPTHVLPPVRPSDLANLMSEVARSGDKPVNVASAAEATRSPSRDSIGQLIRNVGVADDTKPRIISAQRALIKLGYGPTKADGVAGAETRQAIERFERNAKLPVTGELSPRVLRELSATAGLPIE
jgi:Putative peptidoglycan binding domain